MIPMFILSIMISSVTPDLCNFHATLVETETFYLTQPYTKTISLNLSEYSQAFLRLSELLPTFSQNLEQYGQLNKIIETENVTLIPFSSEFNIFAISDDTLGKDAFNACNRNDGSLITVTKENRKHVAAILKQLNLAKTPFRAFPFFSLFESDSNEVIETPDLQHIVQMWVKSPPFLTSENVIEYPERYRKDTSTPSSVETLASDYVSPVLCQKKNNPWDLPESRNLWLNLIPKVKSAISLLQKLKQTYEISSQSFKSVQKSTWTNAANFFKMVLPEPFKATLDFLDTFSKRKNWERTDHSAYDRFTAFVKTALKIYRQFSQGTDSLTHIKEEKLQFRPPAINEMNWRDLFDLDEETIGFVGPVTIQPVQAFTKGSSDDQDPYLFKAKITGRIFNRNLDRISIFDIKPNIFNSEATTAKTLINFGNTSGVSLDVIQPLQCFTPETELFKVCHKLPYRIPDSNTYFDLKSCAFALLSKDFSSNFTDCPRAPVHKRPTFYRADCDSTGQTSLVINSVAPLKANFICDGIESQSKDFTKFPTYINTGCEVQLIENGTAVSGLPQFNPDFLQNPFVGSDYSANVPSIPEISPEQLPLIHVIIICVSISVASVLCLVMIPFLIYYCCKRRSCCRNGPPSNVQNQIVLPQFYPNFNLPNYPLLE